MASSILVVAGEASADLHGAQVLAELRAQHKDLFVFGIGGLEMRRRGLECIAQAEEISIAGLTEILFAIPRIRGIMKRLEEAAEKYRPQVAMLIDLPDFNLRVAKKLNALGIPVVYYISPQVWAWRKRRVQQIRKLVSQMLVVLPFEQAFYEQHAVRSRFVGHPLLDELPEHVDRDAAQHQLSLNPKHKPIVALLPGSRVKEINRHLPIMLEAVTLLKRDMPNLQVLLPVASTIDRKLIERHAQKTSVNLQITDGMATEVLSAADAAVVCSGTATLQAALLGRPMVVVYRVSWLTFQILRRLVKVAHIALVNLIVGRQVVAELVQKDFNAPAVERELRSLLNDATLRVRLSHEFAQLRKVLGGPGAAKRVAEVLLSYLPLGSPTKAPAPQTASAAAVLPSRTSNER